MPSVLPLSLQIHSLPFSTLLCAKEADGKPLQSFFAHWLPVGIGLWKALTGDQRQEKS